MIEITGLHNKQKEIGNSILNSTAKFHSINASRQSGKTHLLSRLAVYLGLTIVDKFILIASPSYDQVEIIFENIMKIENIEKVIRHKRSSKPYEITLISGTKLKFKTADKPDNLRGGTNQYVLFDEYAYMHPTVMAKVRPSTSRKGTKIICCSTPYGRSNHFHSLYELGKDPNELWYESYDMHYTDNPEYDQQEVEDAFLKLPKSFYDQEYECAFISDAGDVFTGMDLVSIIENYNNIEKTQRCYAGIDWGKTNDSSVLTIINQHREVMFIGAYKGDWEKQCLQMQTPLNAYKPILYAESNGVGDGAISVLRRYYNNIRKEFITSNTTKREIIEGLKKDIILCNIKLPSIKLCPELHNELGDYTFSLTTSGNITYHHRNGGHDDYVDSLAMANQAYTDNNKAFTAIFKPNNSIHN